MYARDFLDIDKLCVDALAFYESLGFKTYRRYLELKF